METSRLTLEDIRSRPTIDLWPDAGEVLNLGRNQIYAAARNGEIPTLRIGRRILVLEVAPALERALGTWHRFDQRRVDAAALGAGSGGEQASFRGQHPAGA